MTDEIYDLADAALSGDLTGEQALRLERLVLKDAAARRDYVRFVEDSLMLSAWPGDPAALLTGNPSKESLPVDLSAETNGTDPKAAISSNRWRDNKRDNKWKGLSNEIDVRNHPVRFVAVMIALTAVFWVGLVVSIAPRWWGDDEVARSKSIQPANLVARITADYQLQWAKGVADRCGQDLLAAGERLLLEKGLLQVTFDDGAVVALEGPCEFVIDSAGAGTLDAGKLVARVPEEAVGFSIETPTARIIDLGTEFGVHVEKAGASEVHVFQGEVEVRSTKQTTTKRRLVAGTAARFGADGTMATGVVADANRFVRPGEFSSRLEQSQRAAAGVVSLSGAVKLLPTAPRSVVPGRLEDSRYIVLFIERENVVLGRDLEVSFTAPGTHLLAEGRRPVIPAGTRVGSYLLHFDPVGTKKVKGLRGSVTMGRPILGLIVHQGELDRSDATVGRADTTYPTGSRGRGFERPHSNSPDQLTLSPDRHTLRIDRLGVDLSVDQIRVLIAAPATKEDR